MKITLDIDCTPEEARTFFGLPDLTAVNAVLAGELEKRTRENLDSLADPAAFWERAITSGAGSMEVFSRMMEQAAGMGGKKP